VHNSLDSIESIYDETHNVQANSFKVFIEDKHLKNAIRFSPNRILFDFLLSSINSDIFYNLIFLLINSLKINILIFEFTIFKFNVFKA